MISADNRFCANSNEILVRVEFSKNKLAIVISRSVGTFFIGQLIISLNCVAVCKIN